MLTLTCQARILSSTLVHRCIGFRKYSNELQVEFTPFILNHTGHNIKSESKDTVSKCVKPT